MIEQRLKMQRRGEGGFGGTFAEPGIEVHEIFHDRPVLLVLV